MNLDNESALLIRLAHADLLAAKLLYDADGPTSIICFHAQQVVEKGLKSVLMRKGVLFGKIHDLVELVELIHDTSLSLPIDTDTIILLNPYAVKARYDDSIPDTLTTEEAIEIASCIIEWSETV